ncbi:MAG: hypothetical protein ACMG6E_01275 [Candidatus Roizmanbacteria bacterium]
MLEVRAIGSSSNCKRLDTSTQRLSIAQIEGERPSKRFIRKDEIKTPS